MRRQVTEQHAHECRSPSRRESAPQNLREARGPADTLSVGFQAPGRGESTSLLS